jgi:hypothetical protein
MRWQGLAYQKSRIQLTPVLMNCISQRSNQHQGDLNRNPQSRLSANFSKHTLDKIVACGKGKKKYPARQYKVCAAHKKWSKTTCSCKFYIVLLTKGVVLRNITQLGTMRLYMQFLQDWVQEYHLYSQTARKNTFQGWTCKSVKCPGNWKYLITRPSTWQCVKNHIIFQCRVSSTLKCHGVLHILTIHSVVFFHL